MTLLLTLTLNCALTGKVIQGSPCPEVRTFTNENARYIMKLNDIFIDGTYNFEWMACVFSIALTLSSCEKEKIANENSPSDREFLMKYLRFVFIFTWMIIFCKKGKVTRSDSVLWQKPLHPQKTLKSKETTQKRLQNLDNTTISDRLKTVSWVAACSHPTGVVTPVYGIPTFQLTTEAV